MLYVPLKGSGNDCTFTEYWIFPHSNGNRPLKEIEGLYLQTTATPIFVPGFGKLPPLCLCRSVGQCYDSSKNAVPKNTLAS